LSHTFIIGMQTVQAGHAPLVGTTAGVSALVWLLGRGYLYVGVPTEEPARGHLCDAVKGDQGQAPRLLLRAAPVAAGPRRDERPRPDDRLDLPDDRHYRRGHLGESGAGIVGPAGPGGGGA